MPQEFDVHVLVTLILLHRTQLLVFQSIHFADVWVSVSHHEGNFERTGQDAYPAGTLYVSWFAIRSGSLTNGADYCKEYTVHMPSKSSRMNIDVHLIPQLRLICWTRRRIES